MRSSAIALSILLLVSSLVACGGGGGGTTTPPPPQQPGTLRTIALQGDLAPNGAGTFLAFPVATPMSAADGSWGAFVGDTSTTGQVAYVIEPDGDILPVFAQGDNAPDLASGSIDAIGQVWVSDAGLLVAWVGVIGNAAGVTEGLVSARVDGGVVSNVTGMVYEGANTDVGNLTAFDPKYSFLRGDDFFFRAEATASTGLWSIGLDGSSLTRLVASGDAAPGGKVILEVYAVGVGSTGSQFTFVAETTGIQDRDGVYTGTSGGGSFGEVAVTGDPLAQGESINLIPYDQPLVVYEGQVPTVLYKCLSNLSEDHLILGVPGEPDYLIAREGDAENRFTGGVFGPLAWLNNPAGAANPMFQAGLSGAQGITFGIYTLESLDFSTSEVTYGLAVYDGRRVSSTSSQSFSSTFPGLAAPGMLDASPGADLAFANVLDPSGDTGMFWLVRGTGMFTTAGAGGTIPGGGDTFGSDSSYRSTTAEGVVLFRAPVSAAGSGIFRRGR